MPLVNIMGGVRGPNGEGRDQYSATLLDVKDLWMVHINKNQPTDWILPIGMYLETYTSTHSWSSDSKFGNPYSEDWMWPMCPHTANAFSTSPEFFTDAIDASKSRLLDPYPTSESYQTDVLPTTTKCPANVFGMTTCRVYGWMSYRLGFEKGFTMDGLTCPPNTAALQVQRNVFRCTNVIVFQNNFCRGEHECMFRIPASKHSRWMAASYISDLDKAFFTGAGDRTEFELYNRNTLKNEFRTGFSAEAATRGAILAMLSELMTRNSGVAQTYTAVPSMPLYDREKGLWNAENPFLRCVCAVCVFVCMWCLSKPLKIMLFSVRLLGCQLM